MTSQLASLGIKVVLAAALIWLFLRISWWVRWLVEPFIVGFVAGVLVTILFVLSLPGSKPY